MGYHTDEPLVLTEAVIMEIVEDVRRKFLLTASDISFHFDRWGVSIIVHAADRQFVLPRGPVDVRVRGQELEYGRDI